MEFRLKMGMLLGTATAATQIEGGELDHSWNNWFQKGKIKDHSNPANANQHYLKYEEDIKQMKQLGHQIYRLGIEWVRIEPEENRFDEEAIAHYRKILTLLRDYEIEPLLTLHHFTNPMWFEKKGAFTKKENIPYFLTFVEKVIENYGDLVNEYITINEPNVYATEGYFLGSFPPGVKSLKQTIDVMSVMALAHHKAYERIHEIRVQRGFERAKMETKVSFANHVRAFEPKNPRNPLHWIYAKAAKYLFQQALSKTMYTGKVAWPLKKFEAIKPGCYCDFIGINYYTRSTVNGLEDGTKDGVGINDLGWEIYPEGIVSCARELYQMVHKPIYITENGTCDNNDSFRSRYIYEHLKVLCLSELPIERYYHWSFTDNFEWLEGESARFGLIHVNYKTQERTLKKNGAFFSEIIKNGGVTAPMYEAYVKGIEYKKN